MSVRIIGGYSRDPDPYFVDRDCGVNITDKALKAVGFIGIKSTGKFLPRATCFFVRQTTEQHRFDHLVTAEHVVSGLLTKGHDIWLRVSRLGRSCRGQSCTRPCAAASDPAAPPAVARAIL